jgi:phage gp16-like protein
VSSLKTIHVGQRQLGLADEDYRDLLERATGKRSSADMSERERGAVIEAMKLLGFKPAPAAGARAKKAPKAYVGKIYALWGELERLGALADPSPKGLCAFVHRQTGLDRAEWLGPEQANKVTEGLKAWVARARMDDGRR